MMSLRISPMSNIRQEIQDIQEIQGITEPNTIRRTLADCQQILQETRSVEMNRWHHATSAEAVGDINCTAQTSLTPSPVGGVDMLHWMQQQKATALQELPPTGLGKFQPPTYTRGPADKPHRLRHLASRGSSRTTHQSLLRF
jgi:hypothetical protein